MWIVLVVFFGVIVAMIFAIVIGGTTVAALFGWPTWKGVMVLLTAAAACLYVPSLLRKLFP